MLFRSVFPSVDIKGGVAIGFRDANKEFGAIRYFSEYLELTSILNKVNHHPSFVSGRFSEMISSRGMYRFSEEFFTENIKAKKALNSGTGNMITSNSFNMYPEFFTDTKPNDSENFVQLYGRVESERVYRWIKSK